MFLLGDMAAGGETAIGSLVEFLDNHENALVSFLVGGGGAAASTGGEATWLLGSCSFVAGGDHGIDGRALVMLLKEIVLDASFSKGLLSSARPVSSFRYVGCLIVCRPAFLSSGRVVVQADII